MGLDLRIAVPVGDINGSNTDFATPTPYSPGQLVAMVDGVNVPADDVTETDPANGLFSVLDPPATDSAFAVAYLERFSDSPGGIATTAFFQQLNVLHLEGGNDLEIVAGEAGELITLTILDENGEAQDLTGHDVFFMARRTSESGASAFDKTTINGEVVLRDQGIDAGRGIADVTFTQVETQAQSAQNLVWDCWVRTPLDKIVNLAQGARLRVRASVRTLFP